MKAGQKAAAEFHHTKGSRANSRREASIIEPQLPVGRAQPPDPGRPESTSVRIRPLKTGSHYEHDRHQIREDVTEHYADVTDAESACLPGHTRVRDASAFPRTRRQSADPGSHPES